MYKLSTYLNEFIETYRHDQLVYLRTLKCASTFYSSLFKSNYWQKQKISDIDWNHDHVFSFIMDPMERRLKGLAEFLSMYPTHRALLEITEIWPKISYFDYHSMPYSVSYKDYCGQIDWIPIDHPEFKSQDLVKILLRDNGVKFDWAVSDPHQSSDHKQQIYNKIKELSGTLSGEVFISLEQDLILYDNVCRSIQFCNKTWNSISWLKNLQNLAPQ